MHRVGHRSLIALAALCGLGITPAAHAGQTIRVAIIKGATEMEISGLDLIVKDAADQPIDLPEDFDRNKIKLRAQSGGIIANQFLLPTDHIVVKAPSVYYRLGTRQYRGEMHVWLRGGRITAVNHVDLEDYLVGLINHEINSEWPMPAVKAQAVVARTYALYQAANSRDDRYDLESTVQDQVYGGAQTEDWRSARAVRATAGEVLVTRRGRVIQAYYHSCCGGSTELPENVWGNSTAMKRTVKDPFCRNAPNYTWEYRIAPDDLGQRLADSGRPGGHVTSVRVLHRSDSQRATRVKLTTTEGTTTIGGNEMRRIVGYGKLKSAAFKVTAEDGQFVFRGHGAGHGVGLCQWGAKGMGDTGKYTYRQILGYYYPGLYIRDLYKSSSRPKKSAAATP